MTDGGFPLSHNFYVHMHVSFTHVNKTEDNIWKVTCKRKWNMSRPRQSRTYKQITFGVTVCYNGMSGTLLEHVFFISCPHLHATNGKILTGNIQMIYNLLYLHIL